MFVIEPISIFDTAVLIKTSRTRKNGNTIQLFLSVVTTSQCIKYWKPLYNLDQTVYTGELCLYPHSMLYLHSTQAIG